MSDITGNLIRSGSFRKRPLDSKKGDLADAIPSKQSSFQRSLSESEAMDCQPTKLSSPYQGPVPSPYQGPVLDEVEEHFQRSLRGLHTPKARTPVTPLPSPQSSNNDQKVIRKPPRMEYHSTGIVDSSQVSSSTTRLPRPQAQLASVVVQPASPSPLTPLTPSGGHAVFVNTSHGPQLVPSPTVMSEISQGVTVIELAPKSHDRPVPQQTSVINMISGGVTSPQSSSPTNKRMTFSSQSKGNIQAMAMATSPIMASPQPSPTLTHPQAHFVHMVDSTSQQIGAASPIVLFQMPVQPQPNFVLVNSSDLGFQASLLNAGLAGLSAIPTTSGLFFFHSGGTLQQAIPVGLGTATSTSDQLQHIGGMRNTVLMATSPKTTPTSFTTSVGPTPPTITAAAKVVVPSSPVKPKELSAEHVSSIMGVPASVEDHFAKALGEQWPKVKSLQQQSITAQSL